MTSSLARSARIVAPQTRLSTTRWWHTSTLAEDLGGGHVSDDVDVTSAATLDPSIVSTADLVARAEHAAARRASGAGQIEVARLPGCPEVGLTTSISIGRFARGGGGSVCWW